MSFTYWLQAVKTDSCEVFATFTFFSLAFFTASATWFVCKCSRKTKTIDNNIIKEK